MIALKNTGAGMYGRLANEEGETMRVPQSLC